MTTGTLTWEEFAELRWAAWRTMQARLFPAYPLREGHAPEAFFRPIAPVTMRAGQWFIPRPGSDSATRWHQFTGDVTWRHWQWLQVETVCGWSTDLRPACPTADDPPRGLDCRRCRLALLRERAVV